jgi:hypothetical protein
LDLELLGGVSASERDEMLTELLIELRAEILADFGRFGVSRIWGPLVSAGLFPSLLLLDVLRTLFFGVAREEFACCLDALRNRRSDPRDFLVGVSDEFIVKNEK